MRFKWNEDIIMVIYGSLDKREGYISNSRQPENSYPPMDIVATDREENIWMDLPGVKKEDIFVYIYENMLVIEGRKKAYYPQSDSRIFLRVERQNTYFRRMYKLTFPLKENSFKADLTDGVLHIKWEK